MILLIGATGQTGRATVEHLIQRGVPVRVVTRDPERAAGIPELAGADVHVGDASSPETIVRAFDGVTKLYLVPPTLPQWDVIQTRLIELAGDAGVEHIVRISVVGTDQNAASMSLSYHWKGERELEQSGMAFTHIRGNSFFQNTFYDARSIRSENTFFSCVGALRFAKIDTRDIGEVVATVLTSPGHEGQAYTLTGPESLSYPDLARIMSNVLGRRIRYIDLTVAEYAAFLVREGNPGWLADEFAAIYGLGFKEGSIVEATTDSVQTVLGRSPRSFAQFIEDYRGEFTSPSTRSAS